MTDTSKIQELFRSKLVVINVGTRIFGDAVRDQGCKVVQVDWRPPAGGDAKMRDILEELGF